GWGPGSRCRRAQALPARRDATTPPWDCPRRPPPRPPDRRVHAGFPARRLQGFRRTGASENAPGRALACRGCRVPRRSSLSSAADYRGCMFSGHPPLSNGTSSAQNSWEKGTAGRRDGHAIALPMTVPRSRAAQAFPIIDSTAEAVASSPEAEAFYGAALSELTRSGHAFLLAGTYAVCAYTGLTRATKDLDVFCRAGDVPRIL